MLGLGFFKMLGIGAICVALSFAAGIKWGWDAGRGDIVGKAEAARSRALILATQRNQRLSDDIEKERAARKLAEDNETHADHVRDEAIEALAVKTAKGCDLAPEDLTTINRMIEAAAR